MTTEVFELDRAIALTDHDGRRTLTLTADWNTPNGTANGGYVLAVLLRGVLDHAEQAGPMHPDPLTASISYLKPPTPGPAEVAVTTVRSGRRISVHEVRLLQADDVVVHGVISLHDAAKTGEHQHTPQAAPPFPPPAECRSLTGVIPVEFAPISGRYETRIAAMPGWLAGTPAGTSDQVLWIRPVDGRPIDSLAAGAIVDAYPPVTADLGWLASATVQLTVHFRRRAMTGWALMHVSTRHVIDGYHDEEVELWDAEGRLIATSRQLAILSGQATPAAGVGSAGESASVDQPSQG
ncbi:thioesterase family protein [Nocardioides sp. R-C-SC26]|uniref:thioesterase family protein n=1 Tax=Nocardioides sp. R-C-SC26 TaxID=2870414 RepID=UPI001E5F17AD|nr:thioesterase family protein [Nocardioides sp. R-C-SC26]